MSLNGTVVSSSNNLHPYKALLEVNLSSDAQYKQGFFGMPRLRKPYFRNRYEFVKSGRNWRYHFRLNDAFLTGIDKYLLPGVEVRLRLTRVTNQFILLKSSTNCKPQIFRVKIVNATCLVHMLEFRQKLTYPLTALLIEKWPNASLKKLSQRLFSFQAELVFILETTFSTERR